MSLYSSKRLFLCLLLFTPMLAYAREAPYFTKLAIKDSEDMVLDTSIANTFQIWLLDPDGGHQIQEIYLDFRFDNISRIKLHYDFEKWDIVHGDRQIEVISSNS